MSNLENRLENVSDAIHEWLSPDNADLKAAIDRTVDEDLFSFEDIKYQIMALKKVLKKTDLTRWIAKAGISGQLNQPGITAANVLCLHAGNIPLVGIQDILAVVLSGHNYLGKLSRKDPYLPGTLLKILFKKNIIKGSWSTVLSDLKGKRAEALLFSGSVHSVNDVMDLLRQYGMAEEDIPRLMRTAHFSMALIEDEKPETFRNLANAVFRYGGNGCRSVAMVIAPFTLKSKKCEFTDYAEEFWLENPQHQKPLPSLYHRFAYNRAVGIEQSWLDNFLIEQTDLKPEEPHVLHWVAGGKELFASLARKYQAGLQSIYTQNPGLSIPDLPVDPEPLWDAQQPPIWWKPDGVDPLKWLSGIKTDKTDGSGSTAK